MAIVQVKGKTYVLTEPGDAVAVAGVDGLTPPTATNPIPTSDAGPAWTTVRGVNSDGEPKASADLSGGAVACTQAPVTGQKLVIDDLVVSVDTAMKVTFTEETSGKVVLAGYCSANNGFGQNTFRGKIKLATANKKLFVQTSVAGNISIQTSYHSEA